jgi:hypothetical protein
MMISSLQLCWPRLRQVRIDLEQRPNVGAELPAFRAAQSRLKVGEAPGSGSTLNATACAQVMSSQWTDTLRPRAARIFSEGNLARLGHPRNLCRRGQRASR